MTQVSKAACLAIAPRKERLVTLSRRGRLKNLECPEKSNRGIITAYKPCCTQAIYTIPKRTNPPTVGAFREISKFACVSIIITVCYAHVYAGHACSLGCCVVGGSGFCMSAATLDLCVWVRWCRHTGIPGLLWDSPRCQFILSAFST